MMGYLIGRETFFEHVPKTAGKAALDGMRRIGVRVRPVDAPGFHIGHARAADSNDRRYRWNSRFGFVRRPSDWWLSLWKFAETPESKLFEINPDIGHPFRPLMPWLRKGLSPDVFVEELVNRVPGFASRMFADYLDGADFVGRSDNLGPALVAALRFFGVRAIENEDAARWLGTSIKRVNVSKPTDAHAALSARVVRLVERYETDGFERFDAAGVYTTSGERET